MSSKRYLLNAALWLCLVLYVLFSFFSISGTQITALIGFIILLIIVCFTGPREPIRLPLLIAFSCYTLIGLLSIVFGADPMLSAGHLKKLLEPLLFFWILNSLSYANISDWVKRVGPPSATPNSQSDSAALIQNPGLAEILGVLIILIGTWASIYGLSHMVFSGKFDRPAGTLNNPITFAVFILITLAMTFSRLRYSGKNRVVMCLTLLAILPQLACILATQSREAWLGAFVVFIFFFWKKPGWWACILILLSTFYLAAPHDARNKFKSLLTISDSSAVIRINLWRAGIDMVRDRPTLGCGYYCAFAIWEDYKDRHEILQNFKLFHNAYIQLAVDTGLVGLAAWLSIWSGFFWHLYIMRKRFPANHPSEWIRMGGAGGVVGFLIASIFECHFYDQEIIMILYLIMALAFASPHPQGTPLRAANS